MMRTLQVWVAVGLAAMLVACGGGPSLSEYAEEGEELTATLLEGLEALDATFTSQDPTVESVQEYWTGRLALRTEFLEGIQRLEPPQGLVELHERALDIFSRVVDTETALAARVTTLATPTDPSQWWDAPEGRAVLAVDEEAIAICHAAQAGFDATQEREVLSDVPWVPSEMRDSVRVAFGCPE